MKIYEDSVVDLDFEPYLLFPDSQRDHQAMRTPSTFGIFAYCPSKVHLVKNNFPLINQVQVLHFRYYHKA